MDLKTQESKKSTYASKEAEEPQAPKDGAEKNNSASSKSKTWLWIVILLILAAIVYFAVRSCISPTPTDEGESSSDVPEEVIHDEATAETMAVDAESNADTQAETYSAPEIEESSNVGSADTAYDQVNDNSFSDVEKTAIKVIRGDYGNGQERKDKLGTSYASVQRRVNEMYRQGTFR